MTVSELIEELKQYDPASLVIIGPYASCVRPVISCEECGRPEVYLDDMKPIRTERGVVGQHRRCVVIETEAIP